MTEASNQPFSPDEATWAVVVVHGVGDTAAGKSMGLLANSLIEAREGELRELDHEVAQYLPEVPGPEAEIEFKEFSKVPVNEQTFPMHVRRLRRSPSRPGTTTQAIFAEVYWSNLSKSRNTVLLFVIRLFSVVFNLRYLAETAAAYPHRKRSLVFLWTIYFASVLLCGLLPGVYLVILLFLALRLVGLSVAKTIGAFEGPSELIGSLDPAYLGVGGLIGLFVAIELTRNRWRKKQEAISTVVAAAVVLVIGIVALALPIGLGNTSHIHLATCSVAVILLGSTLLAAVKQRDDRWSGSWALLSLGVFLSGIASLVCIMGGSVGIEIPTSVGISPSASEPVFSFSLVIDRLVFIGNTLFLLAVVTIAVAVLIWILRQIGAAFGGDHHAAQGASAAICAVIAQTGLWCLLVPTLMIIALNHMSTSGVTEGKRLVEAAKITLTLNAFLLLFALVLTFVIFFWRWWWIRRNGPYESETTRDSRSRNVPRMIVHRAVVLTMLAGFAMGAISATHAFLLGTPVSAIELFVLRPVRVEWVVLFGAVVGSALARKYLFNGLHILADVVSHFYHHDLYPKLNRDITDYKIQQTIEARLTNVLREIRNMANVKKLTIVAHSQGTVITIDVLWYKRTAEILNGINVTLVTMGSPFTHLYEYYFHGRYPPLFLESGDIDPRWTEGDDETKWFPTTVPRWINLYRVDDYIGTHINGRPDNLPLNYCLPTGGHTGYWDQKEVMKALSLHLP